jgi:hypothetical protein
MKKSRREFLMGSLAVGVSVAAAGCMNARAKLTGLSGAPMQGYADKPMKKVRVGIAGVGFRGVDAVDYISQLPNTEVTALCDLFQDRIDIANGILVNKAGKPKAQRTFIGPEAYKAMSDWDGVDVVYITAPWQLHVTIALYALSAGKIALVEVPSALTVDDCWELVEASEKYRRPCMMLENCCYGESEMFGLSLVKQGILGEILHGEGGYNHDLREWCFGDFDPKIKFQCGYWNHWRLRYNAAHDGNQYPTHGFGPIAQAMDINRGDKLDYLVSLSSKSYNFERYAREKFETDGELGGIKVKMGDVNTTLIRTALGRSIQVRHNVATPQRGYRYEVINGSNGIWCGYPDKLFFQGHGAPKTKGHEFFDDKTYREMREKYMHPCWRQAGAAANVVGGHGGMDFMMGLRWTYCLQAGLPLDFDVYDLASWCSICELSERSCTNSSRPVDFPDFTRGAWKTTPPAPLATFKPGVIDLDPESYRKNKDAMNI